MAPQPPVGPGGRDSGFPTAQHIEAAMTLLKAGHTTEKVAAGSHLTAGQSRALWESVLNETAGPPSTEKNRAPAVKNVRRGPL